MTAADPTPRARTLDLPGHGHVVIEASAGTSKTYTLERLVVELVVDDGAPIESLLVVTFTEKATFELKARVRRALAEVATGGAEPAARERAARALRGLGGASICTIHAFCQRILQEYAFASGRALTETAVDGARVFARAFRQAVRTRIATAPEGARLLEAWLARLSLDSLERLLADAVRARLFDPATGDGAPFGPAFDAAEVARCLERFPPEEGWAPAVDAELKPIKAIRANTRGAITDRLGKLERLLARFRETGDLLGLVLDVEADKGLFAPFHRKPYDGATELPAIAAGLGAAAQALEALLPTHQALAVHLLLPAVREEIEADKRRAAVFDFDDMLSLVGRALAGPDGARLRSSLRERYRHALIDEFQDTDVVQWRIFKALFFDGSEGHRLFLVGDPKQAIYGFRGADLEAYLGACREVREAGGHERRLERSFRSTAAMVDALGVLYDDAAPNALLTGEVRHGPPLGCGRPELFAREAGAAAIPVVLLEAGVGPVATTVPAAVAAELAALLGEHPLEVGDGRGSRRVGPGDVFVLTRTEEEGLRVGEALRQRDVPYAFYKQGGLFRTDEAADLHSLLGAIADPASTSARMRAALTSFFALGPEDAPRLRAAGATDAITERLWAWHALSSRGDLEGTLRRAIDESGVVRRLLLEGGGERRLVNLRHLVELLGAEAHRTGATLLDLEMTLGAWIAGRAAPAGEDGDVQRLERERDAVQIMTVHKSKGLEAEVVFLAGGFSLGRAGALDAYHEGAERRVQVGRARDAAIADAVTAERRGEDERLLYVALTRARSRLYLPWTTERSRGTDTLWERLRPRLEELDVDGVRFERRPARSASAAPGATSTLRPTLDPNAYADPDMLQGAILAARPRFVVTSYTRLKRAEAPPPAAARPADDPLPGGAHTGIFLHALLEALPLETLAGRPPLEAWQARPDVARLLLATARRHGFDAALVPRAAALVHTALTARLPLDPPLPCLAAARQEREMELLYPLPRHASGAPRGFVRGFVDLVFEHDGKLWVLDWKSDLLADYGDAALDAHVTAHYALQARLYAIGVARLCEAHDARAYDERFGGLVYAFLRGMRAEGEAPSPGVWHRRPSWAELCRWDAELEEVRA